MNENWLYCQSGIYFKNGNKNNVIYNTANIEVIVMNKYQRYIMEPWKPVACNPLQQ